MVSIKALSALLAVQALAVLAAPTEPQASSTAPAEPEVTVDLEDLQGSIYYCSGTYWSGECRTVLVPLNRCHNVPSAWNDRISSIRNQATAQSSCTWYRDYNCVGTSYSNQNDANLSDGNGAFNDSISSYSCKSK